MPLPLALMTAGTVTQVLSNWGANLAQASAESANADFYAAQSRYAIESTQRSLDIASREYSNKIGNIVSGYAGGNVDVGSGSAADIISSAIAQKELELSAIRKKGDLDYRLAQSRANRSAAQADLLGSAGLNLLQGGTTVLTNFASAYDRGYANENRIFEEG